MIMQRRSLGFTLIEMLLALAVFAYVASSILSVLSQTANNLSDIEEMTFASWVANDRLTELQVSTTWPPRDKQQGQRELAGKTWYWSQKVEKTEDPNLRQIRVLVSLEKGSPNSIYSLSSFVTKQQGKAN